MATFEIKMPKLGESITEGTIISWSVKVGDTVEEDDVLFEVSTAKVSAEIPSPVEGKVKQLLIGHFSARYEDESILLQEASDIFPNTLLARETLKISIESIKP